MSSNRHLRSFCPRLPAGGEEGSALLIVFVLAAAIAIMLYRELPVVITEAQREREQLLIDRGTQYQRAVQLYFRNRKSYPPSLDALENTNGMRFLRRRYVDPLTGKADWRLLHMGPAGPIDSLVNPQNGQGTAGNGQQGGSGFGFGSQSQQANTSGANPADAGSGGTGLTTAMPTTTQAQFGLQPDTGAYPTRRPPPVNAASIQRQMGIGNPETDPNSPPMPADGSQTQQLPMQPVDPTQAVNPNQPPGVAGQPVNGLPGQPGNFSGGQANAGGMFGPSGQQPGAGGVPLSNGTMAPDGSTGQSNTNQQFGNPGTTNSAQAGMANQILRTPSPSAAQTQSNPFGGGSVGGVASSMKGHAIKVVNDQQDYSKWEFVYDFRKDTGGSVTATQQGGAQNQQPGMFGNNPAGGSTFGAGNTSSSSFGTGATSNPNTASPAAGGATPQPQPNQ